MGTNYPIEEAAGMRYDEWLRDRVQEIRWDLDLDLDTRPPKQETKDANN